MIRGRVERNSGGGLEPWLIIPVEDANGELHHIDVIVDTAFTGCLTLPEAVISRLGLVRQGVQQATVASGEVEGFDYYAARMLWHGQLRRVEVFESIDQSLLGTELLEGSRVVVDTWEGGDVIIEEVPPGPPA